MRWRCEWCGRPHERNDPPCEECGHHSFERAVVPKAPESVEAEEYVWVCPECDRVHPRNSPPCSRCGTMQLDKRSSDYIDPGTVTGTSWREAIEWWHGVGVVVAVALTVVVGLGAAGVVDLPGGPGRPTVENVPGSAETAGGHSLPTVEDAIVAELNEARAEAGTGRLERDGKLEAVATYYNQRLVKSVYGDGDRPQLESALSAFDYDCERSVGVVSFRWGPRDRVASAANETALAARMVEDLLAEESVPADAERVGVDVHASPGGSLVVTVLFC